MKTTEFLYKTVQGPDGQPSSPRVGGMLLFINACILITILFLFALFKEIKNFEDLRGMTHDMLAIGASCFGIGKFADKIGEIIMKRKE